MSVARDTETAERAIVSAAKALESELGLLDRARDDLDALQASAAKVAGQVTAAEAKVAQHSAAVDALRQELRDLVVR